MTWLRLAACALVGWLAYACGSSSGDSGPVEGGLLVSVAEGQTATLTLNRSVTVAADPLLGTSVSGNVLTIHPSCAAVAYTQTTPELYAATITPADGGAPATLLVQVAPSLTGECAVSATACLEPAMNSPRPTFTCDEPGDGTFMDCGSGVLYPTNTMVPIRFLGSACGSATGPMRADCFPQQGSDDLLFKLAVVDPANAGSAVQLTLTTDAPFEFKSTAGSNYGRCTVVRNHDQIGQFTMQYQVADGSAALGGGQFEIDWNLSRVIDTFSIQLLGCSDDAADCTLSRSIQPGPQWCVASTGTQIALSFAVWGSRPGGSGSEDLLIQSSLPAVEWITSDLTSQGSANITLHGSDSTAGHPVEALLSPTPASGTTMTVTVNGSQDSFEREILFDGSCDVQGFVLEQEQ